MDAKSKAQFINSVAQGQGVPCPNCNTLNRSTASFCKVCGSPLPKPEEANQAEAPAAEIPAAEAPATNAPAAEAAQTQDTKVFTPVKKPSPKPQAATAAPTAPAGNGTPASVVKPIPKREKAAAPASREPARRSTPVSSYQEPESVFAKGLPSWSVEPPQVVVRRKVRR